MLKKYILPLIAAFLSLLYLFSFIPELRGQKREKKTKTALITPQKINQIANISIEKNNETIELTKENSLWKIYDEYENFMPSDYKQVENFISKLSEIVWIYEVVSGEKFFKKFDIDEKSGTKVSYTLFNGKTTNIWFGKQDFTKTMIYMRLENSSLVYKIPQEIEVFLNTEKSFWLDPYFIPRNVFSNEKIFGSNVLKITITQNNNTKILANTEKKSFKIEKILELRHGSLYNDSLNGKNKVIECEVSFENKKNYNFSIYENTENSFIIHYHIKEFDYSTLISSWTYLKFIEQFE